MASCSRQPVVTFSSLLASVVVSCGQGYDQIHSSPNDHHSTDVLALIIIVVGVKNALMDAVMKYDGHFRMTAPSQSLLSCDRDGVLNVDAMSFR